MVLGAPGQLGSLSREVTGSPVGPRGVALVRERTRFARDTAGVNGADPKRVVWRVPGNDAE